MDLCVSYVAFKPRLSHPKYRNVFSRVVKEILRDVFDFPVTFGSGVEGDRLALLRLVDCR